MTKFKYLSALLMLLVGAMGGFFVGSTLKRGDSPATHRALPLRHSATKTLTPRAAFLSSDDDAVDYEKLARVCLEAASRGAPRTSALGSILAEPNSPEVESAKKDLDNVMSASLDAGIWSRGAGFRARTLLRRIPASDVADFENLLRTTLERGDMKPQVGAWVPRTLN